ncbi:MAG TPA: cation:proton antiporter, partial [Candidatus Avamphibacillus intestinigallinarum]|nr:cation:proton antiporter [Candidatus Avamphibacillus intestinigallinarum]
MENAELILIVSILALGIFSQWFAWRIQWPSIVIMSVVGLLIGPVLGVVNPDDALGDLYSPLISLAVALILFEASSSLDFREIQGISKS